jgi:hypothetical protein
VERTESTTPASSNTLHLSQAAASFSADSRSAPEARRRRRSRLMLLHGQPSSYRKFKVLRRPLGRRGIHALLSCTTVTGQHRLRWVAWRRVCVARSGGRLGLFPWCDQIASASSVRQPPPTAGGFFDPEFVVSVADVLHERVPDDDGH